MATLKQIQTRLENGELGANIERELVEKLGFTPYIVNGVTLGWRDPLTNEVMTLGQFTSVQQVALYLIPPGWVWEVVPSGGSFRARCAPDSTLLASASLTKAVSTAELALCVAGLLARSA